MNQDRRRVLSIQSHVSFGYVGNKAASFPLQLLGWDVDIVNTVNFSNHAGYRRFGGTKVKAEELQAMLDALQINRMLNQPYILTGYIPGAESLEVVKSYISKAKSSGNTLTYLLDPVMGDDDRIYVAEDVIPVYKSMLKLADIITPNAFEVELLTDIKLNTLSDVKKALNHLHRNYDVKNIIITSIELSSNVKGSQLSTIISSSDKDSFKTRILQYPILQGYYSGVGDLFSALLLANYELVRNSVKVTTDNSDDFNSIKILSEATERTVNSIQGVLENTRKYASSVLPQDIDVDAEGEEGVLKRVIRQKERELRIIQSQDLIKVPIIEYKSKQLDLD